MEIDLNWSREPSPPEPAAVQEFPADTPSVLSAESASLESLVHHRHQVEHEMPLEDVEKVFREHRADFLAMVREGRVTGICSRVRLGSLLGSRYGFALYSRSPAHLIQVERPLVFTAAAPVRRVLDRALARSAEDFHEDVALVDAEHRLLGLISVDALARVQNRLVEEQLGELRRQHEVLHRQHMDLFQANHALRQAQGLYQGLFQGNALGVALLDASGRIQAHNRRLAELLNLGDEPLEIVSLDGWMSETDRTRFSALLAGHERRDARGGPAVREFLLQVPGRGPRLFRFTTGWVPETGQVCACLDDITEQRSLERNLMRQEKQRLLDTLVGGIAHELNNKLTPVLGFADILADRSEGETRQVAALMGKSAGEAARIIRQLLQLSKPDPAQAQRVDLNAVVEESLLMLKFQVRESECELHWERSPEAVAVLADAAQLKQVVINLVLNALQAMEESEAPALRIAVGRRGGEAFLTVADNGMGIPPENLGRIFDPFFTTKGPSRGSGLGLSICFSIARQYAGDISVESQPGAGAAFTLSLPVQAGAIEPESAPARPAGAPPASARAARVLIADDESVVRLLLQEMVRSNFRCQVDQAQHGAEALGFIERGDYDLVISDIRMPVMAGTEFYLRLRELRPEMARRFVFITGHPGEQSLQDEMARWNVPVLAKPFTHARLVEICQPLLAPEPAAQSA